MILLIGKKSLQKFYFFIVMGALLAAYASASTEAYPPKERISFDKAKAIAASEGSGKVLSSGFENLKGIWVYSFDFQSSDGAVRHVFINAVSGKSEKQLTAAKNE